MIFQVFSEKFSLRRHIHIFLEKYRLFVHTARNAMLFSRKKHKEDSTFYELSKIYENVTKEKMDFWVKAFEVRKRLYNRYFLYRVKPKEESGYRNYENYLLFGFLLCKVYEETNRLKYLNCLLKLNDTILSILYQLDTTLKELSAILLTRELFYIKLFLKKSEIRCYDDFR